MLALYISLESDLEWSDDLEYEDSKLLSDSGSVNLRVYFHPLTTRHPAYYTATYQRNK